MFRWIICLIMVSITYDVLGQFNGGDGDGFALANFNNLNSFEYAGGNSDGYANANFVQNQNFIYAGGNADGSATNTFINLNSYTYAGGHSDGYASNIFINFNEMKYTGGSEDGYASSSFFNLDALEYTGGNSDGYASNIFINFNQLDYTGGSEDGYASGVFFNLNSLDYTGGNGDGYANNTFLNINALNYTGGSSDGYAMSEVKKLIWSGNVDNNWLNPNNWENNQIPNINDWVVIPSQRPNYPIIINDVLSVSDGDFLTYTANRIFIENGGSITLDHSDISNKGLLKVGGNLTQTIPFDGGFTNEKGSVLIISENGTVKNTDYLNLYLDADITFDSSTLITDNGTLEVADGLHFINNSTANISNSTLTVKAMGEGGTTAGLFIDNSSSFTDNDLPTEIKIGGQFANPNNFGVQLSENAWISMNNTSFKMINGLSPATNDIYLQFGKHAFKNFTSIRDFTNTYLTDDTTTILGNVSWTSGNLIQNGQQIYIHGNWDIQDLFTSNNSTIEFVGDDNVFINNNSQPFHNAIISKSPGTIVAPTTPLFLTNELKVLSGDLFINNVGSPAMVVLGDVYIENGGKIKLQNDFTIVEFGKSFYNNTDFTNQGFINSGFGNNVNFFGGGGNHFIKSGNDVAEGTLWGANLNIDENSTYTLLSPMKITGSLNLFDGKLKLDEFNLDITSGQPITTLNNSYLITNDTGSVIVHNIGNTGFTNIYDFPIGYSNNSYLPVTIQSYGPADSYKVRVQPQVLSNGFTGTPQTSQFVSATWLINEGVADFQTNVDITFHWASSDELPNFDHNSASVWSAQDGFWLGEPSSLVTGNNPYQITMINASFLAPYAIGSAYPLSVECAKFNGEHTENGNLLRWQTFSEENNKGFEILRSTDGQNYTTIGWVNGQGTTTEITDYQFIDNELEDINYYYKLKQIDFDETSTYVCDIIFIGNSLVINDLETVNLFPNPAGTFTNIAIKSKTTQTVNIKILNTVGQLVFTQMAVISKGENQLRMDLQNLPKGVYQIVIEYGNSSKTVKQLIKN